MYGCERPTCERCPHYKFNWGTEEMNCFLLSDRIRKGEDSNEENQEICEEPTEYDPAV